MTRAERSNGPLITMADYGRIHSIARAVLDGANAHTSNACIFFSLVGACLLHRYHKLDALPVAGAAFYCLGGEPKPSVLTFARFGELDVESDRNAFHCWVDVEGWAIDFMAPIFHENAAERGIGLIIPRRMFQRRLTTMASSWDELATEGDFHLIPNAELSAEVVRGAVSRHSARDLVEVCAEWYRPSPRKVPSSIRMASSDGTIEAIRLRSPSLVGSW